MDNIIANSQTSSLLIILLISFKPILIEELIKNDAAIQKGVSILLWKPISLEQKHLSFSGVLIIIANESVEWNHHWWRSWNQEQHIASFNWQITIRSSSNLPHLSVFHFKLSLTVSISIADNKFKPRLVASPQSFQSTKVYFNYSKIESGSTLWSCIVKNPLNWSCKHWLLQFKMS